MSGESVGTSAASVLAGGFTFMVAVVCAAVLTQQWMSANSGVIDTAIPEFRADIMWPIWTECFNLLKNNQFCQALAFSSVSYYAVYVAGVLYRALLLPLFSSMSSSIVLHNTDPNFNAVIDYLAEHVLVDIPGSCSSVQATTQVKKWTRKDWIQEYLGTNTRDIPKFDYRPDHDDIIHKFKFKGQMIYLSRSKSGEAMMGADSEKPFTPESMTLTVWGRNNEVLKELLSEALESVAKEKMGDALNIYIQSSSSWLTGWELALTKKARSKDSVILDVDDMEVLLSDARKFLDSRAWYTEKGIPYRRGYMLYGPPGCGKTSFAQVLAGELNLDICMLALTHVGLTDNDLCELLRDAPRNSVIVLEDIDAVFVERDATGSGGGKKGRKGDSAVSFSGLLNAIDGVASQEGKIFFMTTNHIEKLDAALIRPGRCDVKFEVKHASKQQMERMFLRFYPGETALAEEFAKRLPANELSMAALQGHFLNDSQSAEESVDRTVELLQSVKGKHKQTSGTVAECLFRVGVERYAPLFAFHDCHLAMNMSSVKVDSLLLLSLSLKYDPVGKDVLEKVISSEEDFIVNEYAMATVSEIRSSFLSAYPTTYERQTGERSPFLRRHTSHDKAHKQRQLKKELFQAAVDPNLDELPELIGVSRGVSTGSTYSQLSEHSGIVMEKTAEELDSISQLFCEALSRNGKGAISLYNLRTLLGIHPGRPVAALEAAKHFVSSEGVASSYAGAIIQPTTLYSFLKRAGLGDKYYNFVSEIESVEELKDIDRKKFQKKPYKLTSAEAVCLDEILNQKDSETGNLVNFGYHKRNRIIAVFYTFYADSKLRRPQEDSDSESDDSDDSDVEKSAVETVPKPTVKTTADLPVYDPAYLEQLSYRYAVSATDPRGCALVSVLEVLFHLKKHPLSPEQAVSTALDELVSPRMPAKPTPKPLPPPAPKQWIETWLESGPDGEALAEYAKHFIEEGIKTEADLRIGGVIDNDTLKDIMKVEKLGHRRKIIHMQAQLLDVK